MVSALPALAADSTNTAPVSNDAFVAEFHSIIDRVNAKIESGEVSAEVLAPELNAIEALPARHPEQSVDDQAYVLTQEAVIYLQVLHDPIMVEKVLKRIVHDFPTSKFTPLEMENIQKLQPAIALAQIRASLTNGVVFPDFQETDTTGKPVSIAALKGKVVLLDFWATRCPVCMHELPAVAAAYKKYHSQGFEIIGLNQDHSLGALTGFLGESGVPWPQVFDGEEKKLASKYAVESLPTTYLLDGQGRIIARNLRGEQVADAVKKALAAK